ncbi:hypothetical protein [Methylobacterium oryzihabitans]|uniref:Uncharacterized protein n=1 Tax=Methylobacterium oryzihabitans TaxID=2499852 RepID=A0A3S2WAC0_9HYPH|nr:hypothetical protein [Methylobacterium oryzihabitans]RVU17791.1 hypothetical protein EOE48_12985 [Methylobacterium oryzihabitans]
MADEDGLTLTRIPFKKVRGASRLSALAMKRGGVVGVIVRVSEPGYVPPGVTVRSRVDALLMTAEAPASHLTALDADPKVESVKLSRPLRVVG